MRLRVPDGGSLIDALLGSLGDPSPAASGDLGIDDVSAAQLTDALAALVRGDVEYVILEDGDDFFQVAGQGEGPYAVEFSQQGQLREIAGGTDVTAMHSLVTAYHRGDQIWRSANWTPVPS
jgi:hypothetical protein